MGVKTKEEYIESLRQMKPTAYMFGEELTNIVDNPRLRPGIEATGATYELAEKEEYQDLMLTQSPLVDETVSRFTLPPGSTTITPSCSVSTIVFQYFEMSIQYLRMLTGTPF